MLIAENKAFPNQLDPDPVKFQLGSGLEPNPDFFLIKIWPDPDLSKKWPDPAGSGNGPWIR